MRIYTIGEAKAALPKVIPLLERIREATLGLQALQGSVARDTATTRTNGHLPFESASSEDRGEAMTKDLSAALAELKTFEVEMKDPARGLIDFYHERDGRLVYLCFMLGEVDIVAWHEIDAGFAGRQPL